MERRCRVLYLVPSLEEGGVGRVVAEHLRRLPRARFELELATLDPVGYFESDVPDDVPVHILRGHRPSRLLSRRRALRRLVEARAIDIVSSHLPNADFVNLAEAIGGRPSVGRVFTTHADARGLGRLVRRYRFRRWALRRFLAARADRLVFLTHETAREVAGIYGARPEQVTVIPNGVDIEEVRDAATHEAPPSWPSGGLRLLAVGRLTPQKDHATLFRALARARARGLDASLLMLGEGPERAHLERLRDELGLGEVVALPGHADNPYPALRHADLMALPSRFEGFALVILEALALGCPVLAADCPGGPAELLGDGVGALVPAGDRDALADAMVELAGAPERRAAMASLGPDRVRAYGWPEVIERTTSMLLDVATKRGRRANRGV